MDLIKCVQLCISIFALIMITVTGVKSSSKETAPKDHKELFVQHIKHCYNHYYKDNTEFVLPIEIVVGVAIHESDYGSSRFAKQGHNYYGIRSHSHDPDEYMTPKRAPGVNVAKYKHHCESTYAFIDRLTSSKHYKESIDIIKQNPDNYDLDSVLNSINRKYSTSENWPGKIAFIIRNLKSDQVLN